MHRTVATPSRAYSTLTPERRAPPVTACRAVAGGGGGTSRPARLARSFPQRSISCRLHPSSQGLPAARQPLRFDSRRWVGGLAARALRSAGLIRRRRSAAGPRRALCFTCEIGGAHIGSSSQRCTPPHTPFAAHPMTAPKPATGGIKLLVRPRPLPPRPAAAGALPSPPRTHLLRSSTHLRPTAHGPWWWF